MKNSIFLFNQEKPSEKELILFKSNYTIGAGFVNRYYSTKRLTNIQKDSFSISPDLHNIIIGGILGDLHINKQRNNSRLVFRQGLVHKEYIYDLFKLFSSYSNMEVPKHHEYLDKR